MKLVLIGFMGAGKSTVAKRLANFLGVPCHEMDSQILEISSRASIAELFELDGELVYRELETQVADSLLHASRCVISTGGGIVGRRQNMASLRVNAQVIFLSTRFATVKERLGNDTTRPLFKNDSTTPKLFLERKPLYEKYADQVFETDDKTPEEIVRHIVARNKEYFGSSEDLL